MCHVRGDQQEAPAFSIRLEEMQRYQNVEREASQTEKWQSP